MHLNWTEGTINSITDLTNMIKLYNAVKPNITGFDTETTGLNHIKDTPFLFIFGFATETTGYVYLSDIRKNKELFLLTIQTVIHLFKDITVLGHNIKYDLHMLHNVDFPKAFTNVSDTMFYMRLGQDAIPKNHGGPPLALKDFAAKHIDPKARTYERELKEYLKTVQRQRTDLLLNKLKDIPMPENLKRTGRERGWTNPIIAGLLNDLIEGDELLPLEAKRIVDEVLAIKELDPTKYYNVPDHILYKYARYDVIFTIEAYLTLKPIVEERGQLDSLKLEESLIIPLYEMERVGFSFNKEYALSSKNKILNYIKEQRKILNELTEDTFTVGQHIKIKNMFNDKFNIVLSATDNAALTRIVNDPSLDQKPKEIASIIMELRTLEKWYSTYIIKLLNNEVDGRVYTTINQVGAVSGRVSSDFQQFPKDPSTDKNGNVLFITRKLFKVTGEEYPAMIYLDFSQIELRLQAIYTILVGAPDLNLCRAFIPYKCHTKDGIKFELNNKELLETFTKHQWFTDESESPWKATDLHTLTALNAFPELTQDHPEFKYYRSLGKTTNFACNYGASGRAVAEQLEVPIETGNRLVKAYRRSYPGVFDYRKYVDNFLFSQGYVENLFNRRYYKTSAHNAYNYLVQGSAADLLKKKIVEIYDYLNKKNYKTKMQMNIHDELIFEYHKDDPISIIEELRAITESLPGSPIPIVSDSEITYTTWDEKHDT